MTNTDRSVDLWLGSFKQNPYELVDALQCKPYLIARQGDPHGRRGLPAQRNLLVFRKEFSVDVAWPQAIESLISTLGGWVEVEALIKRLDPGEEPLVQFNLPIRNSPHQENDFFPSSFLAKLVEFRLGIGFEFGTYKADA